VVCGRWGPRLPCVHAGPSYQHASAISRRSFTPSTPSTSKSKLDDHKPRPHQTQTPTASAPNPNTDQIHKRGVCGPGAAPHRRDRRIERQGPEEPGGREPHHHQPRGGVPPAVRCGGAGWGVGGLGGWGAGGVPGWQCKATGCARLDLLVCPPLHAKPFDGPIYQIAKLHPGVTSSSAAAAAASTRGAPAPAAPAGAPAAAAAGGTAPAG